MRKSEIKIGLSGDVSYRNRFSGPLKTGETVLRIEVVQPKGTGLDERRLAWLKQQTEAFLATLGDGLQLGEKLIINRLKREVAPDTWNTLLAVGSERAYWLIQAWVAEARLAIECRPPGGDRLVDVEGMLAMLGRWADALQFSDLYGLRKDERADWRHVAANARAQADLYRRRAKSLGPGMRSGVPRPLLARLKAWLSRGEKLLLLGLKTAPLFDVTIHDLLDSHAELILAETSEGFRTISAAAVSGGGCAAVLVLPDVPSDLAVEIGQVCIDRGLPCTQLLSRDPGDLDLCLATLDLALRDLARSPV